MSNRPGKSKSASQRVRAASNAGKGKSTTWIWIAIVGVVIAVGIVAIVAGRGTSSSGGSASPSGGTVVPAGKLDYGQVSVSGTALTPKPDSGADPMVGSIIPTVIGQQFDGKQLTIAPNGKPHIIMVVAHWCSHCQAEVPRVQKWLNASGMPADIDLVTVATSNDPAKGNFPAADWLRREQWSVPTIVDDKQSQAGSALGVSGFPYFIVTDAQGK
ncbi:MAG: redoxin family protein, partial [Actinobacteria bacterium]|nr:redoxin family protein [Actinomycetota bacterium]